MNRQPLSSRIPLNSFDSGANFVLSTQPSIGGKRVRRRKPVKGGLVKKSRFYTRASKGGRIIFDNKTAQLVRANNLYKGGKKTVNLRTYANQAATNEIGRQAVGQQAPQAPIIIQQGGDENINARFDKLEAQINKRNERLNKNDISDLLGGEGIPQRVKREPPIKKEDFTPAKQQPIDIDDPTIGGKFDVGEWQQSPIGFDAPKEADFTDVDAFSDQFDFDEGRAPSVAGDVLPFGAGGLVLPPITPTPTLESSAVSVSDLESLLESGKQAKQDENRRQRRGRLKSFSELKGQFKGRAAALFGGGGGDEPEGAYYVDNPFDSESVAGAIDLSKGNFRNNPLGEQRGGVFNDPKTFNPLDDTSSVGFSESRSIKFEGED